MRNTNLDPTHILPSYTKLTPNASGRATLAEGRNVLTLRGLRDRLSEIIAEHEAKGWDERNDQPVFVQVQQAKTDSGRLRADVFLPVTSACGGSMGITVGPEKLWTTTLRIEHGHGYAAGEPTDRILLGK